MGAKWTDREGCSRVRRQHVQRHGGVKEHGMFPESERYGMGLSE